MGFYPVFVYGSLKSGLENSSLLANALLVGGTRTKDEFQMTSVFGMYPALFKTDYTVPETMEVAKGRIQGEVYLVDESELEMLNQLEQVGKLYEIGQHEIDPVYFVQKSQNDKETKVHTFKTALVYTALPKFLDTVFDEKQKDNYLAFITSVDGIVSWIHPVFENLDDLYEGANRGSEVSARMLRTLYHSK